jgi:hypothetical protein
VSAIEFLDDSLAHCVADQATKHIALLDTKLLHEQSSLVGQQLSCSIGADGLVRRM